MKRPIVIFGYVCVLALWSEPARAELILRNGLVYDTVNDLTWMQDAWYAATSGADDDGRMTLSEGIAWTENLVYAGQDGWRLPSFTGHDPDRENDSNEITQLLSQLGWGWTEYAPGSWDYVAGPSVGPFVNFHSPASLQQITMFRLSNGLVWHTFLDWDIPDRGNDGDYRVWAVRDGAPVGVPEPSSLMLLGIGAAAWGAMRRRRSRRV